MDIYRFFNSKDVPDHLREVGRELSAFEAAYVVDHCDGATLEEKISAWREIVDIMPDCPTAWNHNVARRESTHALLREYVDLQRRMLGMFEEDEGCVYFVRRLRYREWPDWLTRGDRVGNWIEDLPIPFSSLASCVGHLRDEREDGGDEFDRYVVSRAKVDPAEGADGLYNNEIVLDGDFRPLEVSVGGLDERDAELSWSLRGAFVELPVPFMSGDIVIDRTDPSPHPFVFDHLKFWDSSEAAKHGCGSLAPEDAARLDRRVAHADERHGWDDSHMVACGYELGRDYDGPLDDLCDLCYDVFGAAYNYLDLERYDGPLDGELRVLGLASRFMRGEIGVDSLLNCTHLAGLACQAKRLERSYDVEYVPEVRHLYQGGEL